MWLDEIERKRVLAEKQRRLYHANPRKFLVAAKARRTTNLETVRKRQAASQREWRKNNPEKHKAQAKRYYEKHKVVLYEKQRAAIARKPRISKPTSQAQRDASREWKRNNPGLVMAHRMKHVAAKLKALPPWANLEIIELIYAEAQHRRMQVDHIIPLQGKLVCGLHVHTNMQLLTKSQNVRKHNKFDPRKWCLNAMDEPKNTYFDL